MENTDIITGYSQAGEHREDENCFTAQALILLSDGGTKPVSAPRASDPVLSCGITGTLIPGRVTQLLRNVTDTILRLSNGTGVAWSPLPATG